MSKEPRTKRLPKTTKWSQSILALCFLLGLIISSPTAVLADSSTQQQTKTLSYNGKSYTVKWISIDLTDPYLRVKPITASEGIGHVQSFTSMMQDNHALAGINGAFFDAYDQDDTRRFPNGLMIESGDILHSGKNQSLTVLSDKTALIQRIETGLQIKVNHSGKEYAFSPWGVNKYYGDTQDDQVIWYTNDFGKQIDFPQTTKIVIQEHTITAITQDAVSIPEDGQVCMVGNSANNAANLLPHLHIGDKVTTSSTSINVDTGVNAALANIDAAVGAGPLLLKNGAVDLDYNRDGSTDPKVINQSNVRSFIGTDASHHLVMGNISATTIPNMAEVLLQLGLTDAMNLDGGASAALFYQGVVLTAPGRLLSNAFIVECMEHPQIQIEVNGQFVNEFRGYLQGETSMVPFRGILERIGANFLWDGNTQTLTVEYGKQKLLLRPDDPTIEVNGKPQTLAVAPTIVDGHIYLPLRVVIESLGGQLKWNADLYRASLQIP
jgi:exopolysaccharide biosynthesis protein